MIPKKGLLIVIEGIDGAGKSTQARLLLRKLRAVGCKAAFFREPTTGKWGRMLRRMSRIAGSLTPEEELELFLMDRRENVEKNIRPALNEQRVVILDRYYYSTIAYQGAKGIDPAYIRRLNERFAIKPDLVIILDIEARRGLGRIKNRKRKDLLFERERYLARVRKLFQTFRGRRFVHLDATRSREDLAAEIADRTLRLINKQKQKKEKRGRSPRCHPT